MNDRKRTGPDFLCIGAQKAGTTWLYELLSRHPSVWVPPVKELHYFDQLYIPSAREWTSIHRTTHAAKIKDRGYAENGELLSEKTNLVLQLIDNKELTDESYRNIFCFPDDQQCAGEFTPEYQVLPAEGIDHVYRINPKTKILLVIRDPIERAWSHMRMLISQGHCSDSIDDMIKLAISPDILQRSRYSIAISSWLTFVSEKQFLVLHFDEIKNNPSSFLNRVSVHLNLESHSYDTDRLFAKIHVGAELPIPPKIYWVLREKLASEYNIISS